MIIAAHHISKAFLEKPVLRDVSFQIEKGEKIAVVGINGAGKTTLLRILLGEMEPDSGTVARVRDLEIGYLAQKQNVDSSLTIREELTAVKQPLIDMEARLAEQERRMAEVTGPALEKLMEEYLLLQDRFRNENGYGWRGEVNAVLNGLGFGGEAAQQPISTLSGGQKTRVALGRLLLARPDLIILDEPTNHLDMGSIRWLESYLSSVKSAVLIVSHDRYFLDRVVTGIVEIENGNATVFGGNYTSYAERKKKLREEQMHAWLNNQAEIRHQEEVIKKLRQFNREKSIRRAESREKMLNRMEVLDKPVTPDDEMRFSMKPCIRSGRDVLHIEDLGMAFGENSLFRHISFDIRRGEHVALIGDNGTGKTTLLRIINGLLPPREGRIRTGVNVHIGYYDQEHHVLDDRNTVFEEIASAYPFMTNTQIRNLLASFLFTGEDVFKLIASLSGGEKGRVSLAKLMLSECNFLILDEPTNHLDLVSKEVLENALNAYEGTVLYVSHDRYFINRTASRILSLTHEVMLDYPGHSDAAPPACYLGNYDFYLEKSSEAESALLQAAGAGGTEEAGNRSDAPGAEGRASSPAAVSGGAGPAAGPGSFDAPGTIGRSAASQQESAPAMDWKAQKEAQAKLRKAQTEIARCEDQISVLEERNTAIDGEMALPGNATNPALLASLQEEKEQNEKTLEALYEKWEELQI